MSDHLEKLIIDLKESLERQMEAGFKAVNARLDEVNTRFDTQAARLGRQGALLQTGARFSLRMTQWSEKIDGLMEDKDHDISDLKKRVKSLEDPEATN